METISRGFRSSQEVFGTEAGSTKTRPKAARIRDLRGVTMPAKCALLLLQTREPSIFPSMKTLADDMGTSVSTAKRAVRELERAGFLRVTHRNRQTNLYYITVAGDPIPLSPMTQKQVTHDPLGGSPMTPPQVTHDPPPRSPMTPQVAIRSIQDKKQGEERESKSTRSLPPGNHVLRKTLICPKCERAWPEGLTGSACSNCHMEIKTIQRRMDEEKRRDEETRRESEAMEEQRAVNREEAKAHRKEEQAKNPPKTLEEAEAERQSIRQFLFDETGKPYDEAILKHLAQEGGTD